MSSRKSSKKSFKLHDVVSMMETQPIFPWIDGIDPSAIVREQMGMDPFEGEVPITKILDKSIKPWFRVKR